MLSFDFVFVTCQIPFIAMYRKEMCSSLLSDLDSKEHANEHDQREMKWHKVGILH
jgi:transcription elongation factor SPT6